MPPPPRHLAASLALCGLPFVGLVAFLLWSHRDIHLLHPPSAGLLWTLGIAGSLVPGVRVVEVWRRLLGDPRQFRIGLLLQMYASLILGFASVFALLQTSAVEPHFSGMASMWAGEPATLAVHLTALVEVFVDALYLSVVTITTVGFGDIVATSSVARLVVAAEALTGVAFMGLVLGRYFSYCTHRDAPEGGRPTGRSTPERTR